MYVKAHARGKEGDGAAVGVRLDMSRALEELKEKLRILGRLELGLFMNRFASRQVCVDYTAINLLQNIKKILRNTMQVE